MAKIDNQRHQVWLAVALVLLVCLSLLAVLSTRATLPATGHMIYAKYGCIPDDPAQREWGQYLGLSTCR